MKKLNYILLFVSFLFATQNIMSQGMTCSDLPPNPSCGGLDFPAGVNSGDAMVSNPGNNYDCLLTTPNPAWFYFMIDQGGDLTFNINSMQGEDIDYAIWGPFADVNDAVAQCDTYGTPVACSYSSTSMEIANLPGVVSGQVYALLITNFSNQPNDIELIESGTATTDCSIVPTGPALIPTMSEWGLFLFALLILTLGLVSIANMNTKLALTNSSINNQVNMPFHIPFDKAGFNKSLPFACALAVLGFGVIYIFWGEIIATDLIGMAIAIPMVTYIIYLINSLKK